MPVGCAVLELPLLSTYVTGGHVEVVPNGGGGIKTMEKTPVDEDVVEVKVGAGPPRGGPVIVTGSKTHSDTVMGGRVMVVRQVPSVTVTSG